MAVYVKLSDSFYIATPVGRYNPDWAIAFYEGAVKHIYFVAETKGSLSSMQLRLIEESKIHCAREHFRILKISRGNIGSTFFSAGRREIFLGFYLDGGVPEAHAVPKVILGKAYVFSSCVGSSQLQRILF